MKRKFLFVLLGVGFLLILTWASGPLPTYAQSGLRWSAPQRILGYANDSDPPYLVADRTGTVHAFGSQWIGNELAVFYSQWSPNRNWTAPVDILLSPNAHQATVLGVYLDSKSVMHIMFFGGTAESAEIYYAKASAIDAGQTRAWSTPKVVGGFAIGHAAGVLTGDNKGDLFILYNGSLEGHGLYEVHSSDDGDNWSEPRAVFSTSSTSQGVSPIQATLDSQGRLHAVWTVYGRDGNGDAIYYARLESDHNQWSLPKKIATRDECLYEADWGAIVSYKEELIIVYNCGSPPQRWTRRSSDGGATWTKPALSFPSLVGESGYPVLLLDSKKVLHAIMVNRTADNRSGGIWHGAWNGEQWSEAEPVVTAPLSAFAPDFPNGVIEQGNVLLVIWRRDPGLAGDGVWYSYAKLNAPELQVTPLPTQISLSAVTPTLTATREPPASTPTRFPQPAFTQVNGTSPPLTQNSPSLGILVAIIPVSILLLVIVVRQNLQR